MSAGVSKSTERLINIIVCVGAAVVIFGALQKIPHQRLADFFLTAGLLTEALIFLIYAFLPPPGGEMHALVEALPKLAGRSTVILHWNRWTKCCRKLTSHRPTWAR